MKTTLIGLALLLASTGSARPIPGFYAAIAYSPSTGRMGWSGNQHGIPIDADAEALRHCIHADCFVVARVHNGCTAVAVGDRGVFGWGTNEWRSFAQSRATMECEARTSNCILGATVCTYGY